MKHSVGIDIEDVKRFNSLIRNKRFLDRVFTNEEKAYCRSKRNQAQHFAVRFAAKEAVWKAINDRLPQQGLHISHLDIGLKNNISGKPEVVLRGPLFHLSKRISVSLSHTHSCVVAVALFER